MLGPRNPFGNLFGSGCRRPGPKSACAESRGASPTPPLSCPPVLLCFRCLHPVILRKCNGLLHVLMHLHFVCYSAQCKRSSGPQGILCPVFLCLGERENDASQ
jgi:hypothetical protein